MIRKATPQDKELYMKFTDAFYHSEAVLHPVPDSHREAMWAELMRSDDYAECFFIDKDGIDAGFLLMAYTFSQESGGKVAWVEEIFISPEFRGQGLGTEFFKFIKEKIEPTCSRIRLEVEEDNQRAKKLYESLGFKILPYQQMVKELY
ncbi:MAG: GNAT family N-acetyltransferase [Clostridia bacterium]|nr:GNAT family N-acetyltransferase [Clostridia bacterium]